MLEITRKSGKRILRAFAHKVADIPNGVTVATSTLVPGVPLVEGSVIGRNSTTGVFHLVKTALLAANAGATATTYTVKKGHHFKVGDFIMLAVGAKAYAITAIATNSGDSSLDDITVGTTLGAAANAGACIMQAAAESASNTSALPLSAPYAVVGDSYDVVANTNIFAEAWLIGVVKAAMAPAISDAIKAKVSGVHFI